MGNNQTEFEHLVSKGFQMASLMSVQTLARSDGWEAYQSNYLPSMSYHLPSPSFTRREPAIIQRRPRQTLFSPIGTYR
jgi:hypothetical protein